MKITLTTERGQVITIDLPPGENAWITTDAAPHPTSQSLYWDGDGHPLRNRWGQPVDADGELLTIND